MSFKIKAHDSLLCYLFIDLLIFAQTKATTHHLRLTGLNVVYVFPQIEQKRHIFGGLYYFHQTGEDSGKSRKQGHPLKGKPHGGFQTLPLSGLTFLNSSFATFQPWDIISTSLKIQV